MPRSMRRGVCVAANAAVAVEDHPGIAPLVLVNAARHLSTVRCDGLERDWRSFHVGAVDRRDGFGISIVGKPDSRSLTHSRLAAPASHAARALVSRDTRLPAADAIYCPTLTSGPTDIPGRSRCSGSCPWSSAIFTGMRCTTLT